LTGRKYLCGSFFAALFGMSPYPMTCPACGTPLVAPEHYSESVGWYRCPECDLSWMARMRGHKAEISEVTLPKTIRVDHVEHG
jgi:hypothetical protein